MNGLIARCCIAYNQVINNQPEDERDQTKAMQAAIAAHSAFIREAAARDDVVEAGDNAVREIIGRLPPPTAEEVQEARFKGMLDQIERTPDAT
jgi:hypothetical protein